MIRKVLWKNQMLGRATGTACSFRASGPARAACFFALLSIADLTLSLQPILQFVTCNPTSLHIEVISTLLNPILISSRWLWLYSSIEQRIELFGQFGTHVVHLTFGY